MKAVFARSLALLLALLAGTAAAAQTTPLRHEVLDDFRDAAAWQASASDQVRASTRVERDGSLCLDYDFAGVSGYAVLRRALPMRWPERFDLVARLKGSGATNDLQFKLVDASGDNVWWMNRPNQTLPAALTDLKIRRRHIDFAWGPATDRSLRTTQFVEFVVAAGRDGGRGALCVAKLTLAERPPDPQPWPEPRVTTRVVAQVTTHVGAQGTVHGTPHGTAQRTAQAMTLDVDFGQVREFNGVALRWPARSQARAHSRPHGLDYDLLASDDARTWRTLRQVRGSDGGLDLLYLPENETRHLRVALRRGHAPPQVELRSASDWPGWNAVLSTLGADAPRGDLPRSFVAEQNYWTLIGVDGGGERSGLLSEDGALEVGRGGFSVEPSVQLDDGTRVTWAGVTLTQSLRDGYLPVAGVRWQHAAFTLDIEAAADGPRDAPELIARYRLRNTGARPQTFTLMLAVRPWQVNPPQQFLATQGGSSPIHALRWAAEALTVNRRPPLVFTMSPKRVSALHFDGGVPLAALQSAPALRVLNDAQAHASAAVEFQITLAPGAERTLGWAAGLGARVDALADARVDPRMRARARASARTSRPVTQAQLDARFDAASARWRERLNRVTLRVPPDAQPVVDTLRTSLAHILMSRDGPALQPGTRSYARSWVRDGAMMVAGLVRLGEVNAAREFVDWFAGHIFDSGKVPCCIDRRGADPVVENDSHGQYLYAVAELWRHARDRADLERHWPRVQRVTAWMESLRQSERTPANRIPERAHLFGLMPPSISHEGYSDKPAYSYWDDFWALRGFKDAVLIARALGREAQAAQWALSRDEFERELVASIAATALRHGIGYIAGAADRGDFDATSTTIALNPAQAQHVLPAALLAGTFERYWQEVSARSEGRREWKDYTPYELRTVGALVRLGQPERAHALLRFFFNDRRPPGWNQWAEVVLPKVREARFLGDMPHAWVSSDYIRSALDLVAYEREHAREHEAEATLVIGAGVPPEWREQGDLEVLGLSTPHGRLDYRLLRTGRGWTLDLQRAGTATRLAWPGSGALPRAVHEGRALAWQGRELALPSAPASVQLTPD